jgi:hypothetical protein
MSLYKALGGTPWFSRIFSYQSRSWRSYGQRLIALDFQRKESVCLGSSGKSYV